MTNAQSATLTEIEDGAAAQGIALRTEFDGDTLKVYGFEGGVYIVNRDGEPIWMTEAEERALAADYEPTDYSEVAPLQSKIVTVWTVVVVDYTDGTVSTWSATTKQKALASLEEDYGADLPELVYALDQGGRFEDMDQTFTLTESTLLGA